MSECTSLFNLVMNQKQQLFTRPFEKRTEHNYCLDFVENSKSESQSLQIVITLMKSCLGCPLLSNLLRVEGRY